MKIRLPALLACLALAGAAAALARPPATLAGFPTGSLTVHTAVGEHHFRVWLADTAERRSQGLMFVEVLQPDQGMLFLFDRPQPVAFWMKNTPLSLDIVFIAADGRVVNIARDTRPFSERPIGSAAPVTEVLELVAGTAKRIGLEPGDRVRHPPYAAQDCCDPAALPLQYFGE